VASTLPFGRPRAHAIAALNHQRFSNIDAHKNTRCDLGACVNVHHTEFLAPRVGQTAAEKIGLQDVYGSASWVPKCACTIDACNAVGKTRFERATAANFDGATGLMAWARTPTALLNLATTLSRETSQESGFPRLVECGTVSGTDFSQVTNASAFQAGYEVTGKIALSSGLAHSQRNRVDGFTVVAGNDSTTTVALGAQRAATRIVVFDRCASRESSSAMGIGATTFKDDGFGCFGQITLD
jgi:hypothetical protein